jgi:hypothetical protein
MTLLPFSRIARDTALLRPVYLESVFSLVSRTESKGLTSGTKSRLPRRPQSRIDTHLKRNTLEG